MGILHRQPAPPAQAEDPDALLVAWAQENPRAFTALYDRYFAAVHGYCLSQLGDAQAAEDAASQTFLKALAALPGYRETGRFRSWLFAIAHNAVSDALRARSSDASLEAASDLLDPAASPEERAMRHSMGPGSMQRSPGCQPPTGRCWSCAARACAVPRLPRSWGSAMKPPRSGNCGRSTRYGPRPA